MEIVIRAYSNGETLTLTTDSPASHYGMPVLRYSGCKCPDMGPADHLCEHANPPGVKAFFGEKTAAEIVCSTHLPFRATEESWDADQQRWVYTVHDPAAAQRDAFRRFCAQWPDGPQVP